MTSWLIVGLGNPGREYEGNRHNVGFMAVDALADAYGSGAWKTSFQSELRSASIDGLSVLLQKPQTYMNLSGESVGAAMRYYKIPLENIIVLHDELDIPAISVRIKQGGGNGGHNGLRSIDQHCGQNYWRIRIGIGHPGDKDRVTGHVLNDFTREENENLQPVLKALAKHFGLMFDEQSSKLLKLLPQPEIKKETENGL